jgi:hypothetical protein
MFRAIINGFGEAFKKGDEVIYDIFANKFFSDNNINKKKDKIIEQSNKYKELLADSNLKRERLLDTCFLGGDLIGDIILNNGELPEDVITAFEKAYPNLSAETTLEDVFRSMNDNDELQGLVSGIKGKLFEMRYADYLNDGELPDGFIAELASSPTQPGWDIQITGPDGEVAELLQAKATDSVSYVQEALERYPDIDVVTTDEVYSHLILNDAAENIIGSSISNEDLGEYVEQAVSGSGIKMDWSPPILSLAMIAFSTYRKEGLDLYGKAKEFGGRFGASYICLLLGKGAATLTGFWPLGIVMSLSARYWGVKGRRKREMTFQLSRIIDNNEKIIKRLEGNIY